MVAMTRARTLASGLGNPPLLQRLLDAVTRAFVCLVQGVAATFGMRFKLQPRDWHTGEMQEALPQTKPDIHQKDFNGPPGACPSVDTQHRTHRMLRDPLRQAREERARHLPRYAVEAKGAASCLPQSPRDWGRWRAQRDGGGLSSRPIDTTVIPAEAPSCVSGMTLSLCVQISPI